MARFFKSSTGTSPSYSAVYIDIVSGFVDGNHEAIERAIQSGKAALMEDGNLGLAKLVLTRLSRFKLLKLTKVYSSIPLHRVQIICGFESVEAVENAMVRMVATGEIRAKIDKASAMVYFVDSEDDYDSSDSRHELTPGRDNRDADLRRIMGEKLEEAMRMSDKLQALQQRLLSSKSYVMKAAPRAGTKEGAGVTALPGEDVDMDF